MEEVEKSNNYTLYLVERDKVGRGNDGDSGAGLNILAKCAVVFFIMLHVAFN